MRFVGRWCPWNLKNGLVVRVSRVVFWDIAKAFAIVCVVVGHSASLGVPQAVVNFCFTFHMPLFFIASGYFAHRDARLDGAYVKKSARSLLLPYAATCAIVVVLTFVKAVVFGHADPLGETFSTALAALYGSGSNVPGMPAGVHAIGAVWFLLALFWAKMFLAASRATPCAPLVVLGLFALGYASKSVWLPFSVQAGLCATLFLYVGQELRAGGWLERGALHPLVWCAVAGMWLYCIAFGGHLYMVEDGYGDGVVVDVLGGVCGTLCVVKASQAVEAHAARLSHALGRLGAMTLPLFCMHLVELDVMPWGYVVDALDRLPVPLWLLGLAVRFALIALMAFAVHLLPRPVSGIFFPGRASSAQTSRIS